MPELNKEKEPYGRIPTMVSTGESTKMKDEKNIAFVESLVNNAEKMKKEPPQEQEASKKPSKAEIILNKTAEALVKAGRPITNALTLGTSEPVFKAVEDPEVRAIYGGIMKDYGVDIGIVSGLVAHGNVPGLIGYGVFRGVSELLGMVPLFSTTKGGQAFLESFPDEEVPAFDPLAGGRMGMTPGPGAINPKTKTINPRENVKVMLDFSQTAANFMIALKAGKWAGGITNQTISKARDMAAKDAVNYLRDETNKSVYSYMEKNGIYIRPETKTAADKYLKEVTDGIAVEIWKRSQAQEVKIPDKFYKDAYLKVIKDYMPKLTNNLGSIRIPKKDKAIANLKSIDPTLDSEALAQKTVPELTNMLIKLRRKSDISVIGSGELAGQESGPKTVKYTSDITGRTREVSYANKKTEKIITKKGNEKEVDVYETEDGLAIIDGKVWKDTGNTYSRPYQGVITDRKGRQKTITKSAKLIKADSPVGPEPQEAKNPTELFMNEAFDKYPMNPLDRRERVIPVGDNIGLAMLKPIDSHTVDLYNIRAGEKGKGIGTQMMKELTALADKHAITLTGIPAPSEQKSMTKKQLTNWYKKFGFIEDEVRGGITRYPRSTLPKGPKQADPNRTDMIDSNFDPSFKPSGDKSGFVLVPGGQDWNRAMHSILSAIDIEYNFTQAGAPQTGFNVKNFYSYREYENEVVRDYVKRLTKFNLTQDEYVLTTYVASQPTLMKDLPKNVQDRIRPAVKLAREYFDKKGVELKELGAITDPYPKSHIKYLKDENLHLREALPDAENPAEIQKKINENQETIDFLQREDIKFVHIPTRVWLEDLLVKDPSNGPLAITRFFKQRKTADLKGLAEKLIKDGVITKKDVDIRSIMGAYSSKVGRSLALSRIFNSAKAEGLVRSLEKAPSDWVSLPPRLAPEFRGLKAHPAFANYIEKFLTAIDPSFGISRVLGYTKLLAFDNPFFLLAYNIEQGFWAGTFKSIKTPSNVVRALKTIWTKDKHYWDAHRNGAFSKPYIPPFEEFQKEIELLMESNPVFKGAKWLIQRYQKEGLLGKLTSPLTGTLDMMYKPLWHIAWNFSDKYPRMMTYHHFLRQGLTPQESAQVTAKFHGDYASLPPAARRSLNRIFFTPSFKIIMTKLHGEMIKESGKAILRGLTLGKKFKQTKAKRIIAGGLINLLALEMGRRMFFKGFGFREEDMGLRYVKDIETDEGLRELVIYAPSAASILLRYYHRWKDFPADPEKLEGFINRTKWELQPLYQTAITTLQNRRPDGNPIYNPFDDPSVIADNIIDFAAKDIISVLDRLPAEREGIDKQKQAIKALKNDLGNLYWLFNVMTPTKNVYLRKPKEVRTMFRARSVIKVMREYLFMDPPKNDREERMRAVNFQKKLQQALDQDN